MQGDAHLQNPTTNQIGRLVTLYESGKYSAVVEEVQKLLISFPRSFRLWNILGMAYRGLKEPENAIDAFQKVQEIRPDIAAPLNSIGVIFQETARMGNAISCFKKAVELEPDNPGSHYNLANALRDNHAYEDALDVYRETVKLKPTFAEAHNNMGNVLQDLERLDEAVAAYRRAIDHKSDYVDAYFNMARALKRQGRPKDVIAVCHQVLTLKPNHHDAQIHLAIALKTLGRRDESIQIYQQIAFSNPEDVSEKNRHSALCSLLTTPIGGLDSATLDGIEARLAAGEKAPHLAAEQLFMKANLLMHRGDVAKAAGTFEKANTKKRAELFADGQNPESWKEVWHQPMMPLQEASSKEGCPLSVLLILGPSRSGKSTLEALLADNKAIVPRFEAVDFDVLKQAASTAVTSLSASEKTRIVRRALYLEATRDRQISEKLIVCTNPHLVHHVPILNTLLNEMFIVWIKRNTPDLMADIYTNMYARGNVYSYDIKSIGAYLQAYDDRMSLIERSLPNRVIRIGYQDMLDNPNAVVDRISSLTGKTFTASNGFDPKAAYRHLAARSALAAHLDEIAARHP